MTIANGLGLTAFTRDFHTPIEGQVFDLHGVLPRAWRNPSLAQISTVTITGFGADDDSIALSIQLPSGSTITVTTTRASAVPVDDAAAAAALAVLVNAHASLYGHVVATSALGVLTLTFDHAGVVYAVSTVVVACVATVATATAAGGSTVPYGRFVAASSVTTGQTALRPLTSTDRDAQVRGITARPQVCENFGSTSPTAVDGALVGTMVDVVYDGHMAMRNNGSVAAVPGGQVHAVLVTTGGDEVGEARSDASGVAQVITLTPGAGQNSVPVSVLITVTAGEHTGKSLLLTTTADGSMTATEVCDAWRVIINADAFWSTILVDSGTATLIITAADSTIGLDATQANGVVTVDTATTARVPYTTPLDVRRFAWAEHVAVGAVGPIEVRC